MIKEIFKRENGSMAVYTSVVLLTMLIIITAIFITSNMARATQLQTAIKVKESYEKDNIKAGEIYAKLTENTSTPSYVTNGLILHYDAINNTGNGHDNNATVWKDLSGNGNDGNLVNMNNTAGSGWDSDSLILDGVDDYVHAKNPAFTSIGDKPNITVEVVSSKETVSYGAVLSFTLRVNEIAYMDLWTATDDYRLYEAIFSGQTENDKKVNFSIGEYQLNKYNLITYGKDDKNYFAYLNGQYKEGEQVSDMDIGWTNDNLVIGASANCDYPFKGRIKSIRIYNRALTAEEIIQNYNIDKDRYNLE